MEEDFRKKVDIGRKVDALVQKFYDTPKYEPIFVEEEVIDRFSERMKLEHPYDEFWAQKNVLRNTTFFHYEGKASVIVRTGDRAERMRQTQFEVYLSQHEDNDFELNPPIDILNWNRCKGYSTRKADRIIAEYFNRKPGEEVMIVDHYPEKRAHYCLANFVFRRLEHEYGVTPKYVKNRKYPTIIRTEIPGFDENEEEKC